VRPVNLIPPEERGAKAPVRTGPIAYMLVGALALGLAAVTMLVLTNNKVNDRKAEIADLQVQEQQATQRAQELASFANFDTVEQQRRTTVASLADSRFDWERVMNELGRILPSDVWLVEMTGKASASASAGEAAAGGDVDTGSIAGPSLIITGCATGQEAVAGFLSALRDIDGVTRVGLASSEKPTTAASAGGDAAGGGGGPGNTECRTEDFIPKFQIIVAFDDAPVPAAAGAAPVAPASPTTPTGAAETASTASSETTSSASPTPAPTTGTTP
jgi:Tfp pilus assembly protein PilN